MTIFQKIVALLDEHHVQYQIINHPPTYTSEESAHYRGEPLKIGAKAMVLKVDSGFIMAVLPADRKIDSKKLKEILNSTSLRFATPQELLTSTGLVPGAVPPFGSLFEMKMIVDAALFEEECMAFNAGSLEKSIKMKTTDYQIIVQAQPMSFSNGTVQNVSDTASH